MYTVKDLIEDLKKEDPDAIPVNYHRMPITGVQSRERKFRYETGGGSQFYVDRDYFPKRKKELEREMHLAKKRGSQLAVEICQASMDLLQKNMPKQSNEVTIIML